MVRSQSISQIFIKSGSQILVEGEIRTGSYEKEDGTKVYTTDVLVNRTYFIGSKKQEEPKSDMSAELEVTSVVNNDEPLPF